MPHFYNIMIDDKDYSILNFDISNHPAAEISACLPQASIFTLSLLRTSKGLFVLRDHDEKVSLELVASPAHFAIYESHFFINKSYLHFWRPFLLDVKQFDYPSLVSSIRQN